MGRDLKVGLDYFPVYHDFFQNKKIKALRRAHGPIGLLTYLNLLCRVYDNGYYYRFDSLEELAQDIAEEIASEQLRKVAARVTETIHYLVGHQILDEELFEQDVISGVAMQEQYIKSAYRAKRKIKMDTYLLVDVLVVLEKIKENSEEIGFSSEEIGFSTEKGTQSKSKSKKEEKKNFFNTTTTARTHTHAHDSMENTSDKIPPTLTQVSLFFQGEYEADNFSDPLLEAEKFVAYNAKRGWDCLPNWEVTAELWAARIRDHKRGYN